MRRGVTGGAYPAVMATTRREVVQTVVDGVTVEVRRSAKRRRTVSAYRQEGRLVVLLPARMSAAAEDLHHRHRQRWLGIAGERDPQRYRAGGCRGVERSHRDSDHRIAAEARFVRRAIKLDEPAIDSRLICDRHSAKGVRNLR